MSDWKKSALIRRNERQGACRGFERPRPFPAKKQKRIRLERRPKPGTRAYEWAERSFLRGVRTENPTIWSKHAQYRTAQEARRAAQQLLRKCDFWSQFEYRIVLPDGTIESIELGVQSQ